MGHSKTGRILAGLACLAFAGAGTAAPAPNAAPAAIACGRAANAVQRLVCTDAPVRALDAQMAGAYASALRRLPAQRDALVRDQRNWLAERDDQAWALRADPATAATAGAELARIYRERIAFLGHAGEAIASPVLARLDQALSAVDAQGGDVLTAPGAEVAQEQRYDSQAELLAHLPGKPTDALSHRFDQDFVGAGDRTLAWLPQAGVGGAYVVQGTADCAYWVLFAREGGQLVPIDTPDTLAGNCWNTQGHLAEVDRQVVALQVTRGLLDPSQDWQVQAWDGRSWGRAAHLRARFDHVMRIDAASCATGVDCAAAKAAALDYARRHDREPLPQTLADAALPAAGQARYARMRALAKSADAVAQLPQPGQRTYHGLDGYGSEAVFFPARLGDEWVLGRIGHGHVGWRVAGGWLVGFWRLDGDRLVPLAGVAVASNPGGFLLAAPLAPAFEHH